MAIQTEQELVGIAVLVGTFLVAAMFVCAHMERRLAKIDAIIDDSKYVN